MLDACHDGGGVGGGQGWSGQHLLLKGKVLLVIFCYRGGPPPVAEQQIMDFSACVRNHPKSFRIWSFQTDVALRFQGIWLKLSHLGEIFDQSWKIGGEFDILTAIRK